jgi:CDGSH iron-sulfur domain-containing protein 3
MIKPEIAKKEPYEIELEKGTYFWCACGKSKTQPFCDGSHNKESMFEPVKFKIEKKGKYWLCGCKHTGTPPFCDGTHIKL